MAEAGTLMDRRGALVRSAYNQIAELGFVGLRTRGGAGVGGGGGEEGNLRLEMNSEEVGVMVVARLRNLTLPMVASGARGDQALRQLERWLGVDGSARKRSSN